MKIVSFINYKGGVGKTTLAANVAADLAARGKRVLAIDLDPQSNFTFSFFKVDVWKNSFQKDLTIKNWYDDFINGVEKNDIKKFIVKPENVSKLTRDNLDIICSHLGLINVDLELAVMLGGATPKQQRRNYLKIYSHLKNGLEPLKDSYDIIIIDCPPNFNIVTKNALVASDYYVIPAKPDYLSTLGIDELRRNISELIKDYNDQALKLKDEAYRRIELKSLGMIANMIGIKSDQPIAVQRAYIIEIKKKDIPVFRTKIRDSKTVYADAPKDGVPVVLKSGSDETFKKVSAELKALTDEFMSKVGLQ